MKILTNSVNVSRLSKTNAAAALLLVLMLSTVAVTVVPLTNAHTPAWSIPTYAYLVASPDPVGVGQTVFLTFWIDKVPPTAAGVGGDRWTGYTLTITKPDGTTETKGPYTSYAESSYAILYTPTQTGTYTVTFRFPGQVASLYNPTTGVPGDVTSAYINDTYLASSTSTTFTVSNEAAPVSPTYPLPTSFWTRPIDGQNTAWTSIASNYLGAGVILDKVQPNGAAPSSAHVMWTKEYQDGGIVGGDYWSIPSASYYTGLSYQGKFSSPLIINGRLYYKSSIGDGNPASYLGDNGPYMCVDLLTGETIWTNDNIYPTFGQLYLYESMNQHGVQQGYLIQSVSSGGFFATSYTWIFYDSLTGKWLFNMTNVPTGFGPGWFGGYGSGAIDSNGAYQIYNLNIPNKWLALWTTAALPTSGHTGGAGTGSEAYQYRPVGKSVNMANNYQWNVTIPELPAGSSVQMAIPNDLLLVSTTMSIGFFGWGTNAYTMTAISLKESNRGQILWQKTYPAPSGNLSRSLGPIDVEKRVFTMTDKETMQWLGYDLDTGALLWGPVGNFRDFQYFGQVSNPPAPGHIYDGKLIIGGYGGELKCFDTRTGELLWNYNNTFSGDQTPWGLYPLFVAAIADGKVYCFSSEHSPNVPLYKGSMVRCIDVNTGKEIWTLDGWYAIQTFGQSPAPIADGYMTYLNVYDMQIYCIGKGPSEVTVEAPMTAVDVGDSMMIRGTVADICAGAKSKVASGEFNIVPAMSDKSQHDWMAYIYQQKPMPTDAVGVQVTLLAIDDGGAVTEIGTVTSDASGMFKKAWTPTVAGEYTIVASFDGTNSYYGSSAETAVVVTQAAAEPTTQPTATPTETAAPTEAPTQTVAPTVSPSAGVEPASGISTETLLIAGAAVVIVIAVIAAALVLRKHK